MDQGYHSRSAIRFVSNHYRLPEEKRFTLARVVIPAKVAKSRQRKQIPLNELRGQNLIVDGYNVLITTESLLIGAQVYRCDDGFLRDTRGIFGNYKPSDLTISVLDEIFFLLKESRAARVRILLDQQISKSGELASIIRMMMAEQKILGTANTARNVDLQLKVSQAVVATGDGSIIDAATKVIDLPAEVARRRKIKTIVL
ncbi:MAG: DUF434 domain-containing protein [Methanotrichaceae archaeon]